MAFRKLTEEEESQLDKKIGELNKVITSCQRGVNLLEEQKRIGRWELNHEQFLQMMQNVERDIASEGLSNIIHNAFRTTSEKEAE